MRATYYASCDKIFFRKSIIFAVIMYFTVIASLFFSTIWEQNAIGILHDETHDTNILVGILLVVPIFLIVFTLLILSLTYAYDYKQQTATHDLLKPYSHVIISFNYTMLLIFIVFSIGNVIHLLYLR